MDQKGYVAEIRRKFSLPNLASLIERLKGLRVLVVGDAIIDHYVFVYPKGRAVKDPILSTEFDSEEIYAGGAIAVANHISTFVKDVTLITLLGDINPRDEFIKGSLMANVNLKAFTKKGSPTIVKKRYVDAYRNHKLFKVEYTDDKPIDSALASEIANFLDGELPKYDIVIVSDFGHGLLNDELRRKIEEKAKFVAINTQTNSSNMGFNYFTLYKKADFVSMGEIEARLPISNRFGEIAEVAREIDEKTNLRRFLITQGKLGSLFYNGGRICRAPVLVDSIKDTVGAGDAAFSIASLIAYLKTEDELVPFLANCAGGIASNVMGNKESVTKEKLVSFIGGIYNEVG